jgi:gliding-associated putative ABC transporter substrate-binding component GldG
MDLECDLIPFVVGGTQDNPQLEYLKWNYFPFLNPANAQIGKNQGYVSGKFVNSVDTIQVKGVRKTPVLVSSPNSRIISTPAMISLNENRNVAEDEKFRRNAIPAGMLLEGSFPSLYSNRITQEQQDSLKTAGLSFKSQSPENKIIVIADGDMVLNDYIRDENDNSQMVPIPMGWNKFTYTEYIRQTEKASLFVPVINREFFKSCIEYLVNDPAINATRNKNIVLRLLDSKKISSQQTTWQFINIGLPILLIMLAGLIYQQVRKRKYQ